MKRILYVAMLSFICGNVHAGLITHNDYTSGNVITASGQNTNENTIVNEFNGSIDNTNIKTGGVTSANILDGTIVPGDLSTIIQSSMTSWNSHAGYRRPTLKWIDTATVDIANNTGTSNETCVIFPDSERRCVTENTSSTDKYRRFIITSSASFTSGTEDSGMYGKYAPNEWFALYAVKSQINSSNFVIAGSTNSPVQADFARLNTMFGTNAWTFLGDIRWGNGVSSGGLNILAFKQTGCVTMFTNVLSTNETSIVSPGLGLKSDNANVNYAYTSGMGLSDIPPNIGMVYWYACNSGVASIINLDDSGRNYTMWHQHDNNAGGCRRVLGVASEGLDMSSSGGSVLGDIMLVGYIDDVLSSGMNPQL